MLIDIYIYTHTHIYTHIYIYTHACNIDEKEDINLKECKKRLQEGLEVGKVWGF